MTTGLTGQSGERPSTGCAGTKARFLTGFAEKQSHREGVQRASREAHYGFSVALLLGEPGVGIFLCSTHGDAGRSPDCPAGLTEAERRLFQLAVFRRAQYLSQHPMIRAYAQKHTAYTLKRIAESLAAAGRYLDASSFAREALRAGPTLKWTGYTAWLTVRALLEAMAAENRATGRTNPPGPLGRQSLHSPSASQSKRDS